MDAARAAMGQGWPFAAGPWSNDGAREPDAVGPDARGKTFWLLLGQLPKVTRRKGGTVIEDNTKAAYVRRLKLSHTLNLHASKQRIAGNAVPRNELLVIMLKHLHRKIRLQQRL